MSTLLRWQVGAVRITRVQELEAPGMRFIVPQATLDNLASIPWLTPFLAANGDAVGSVHALVLEVADRRIIVDTCIGNDKARRIPPWNKRQGPFLTQLIEARKTFMARYADTPTLIVGTHFAGPTAGRLVRAGDAYRLAV